MEQKPSVGRIVHFHPVTEDQGFYDTQPRAAIITSIRQEGAAEGNPPGDGSMVDLTVFDPPPESRRSSPDSREMTPVAAAVPLQLKGVWFSDTPMPGRWTWPPRV